MAVSATVSPGKIFSTDEAITISELNKLGTPTVDISGAVGSLSISTNSINNSHVQAAAAIQLDKLASGTDAQIPICSATGVPTYVTLTGATVTNAGVVSLGADSIDSDQYVDGSIDTAHLSDDAVTADKLADTAVTAAAYTNASITVDAQGRVTAASSGGSPSVTVITTDGDWTKPTGATLIQVTVFGAGGGGGDVTAASGGEAGDGGVVSDWIDVTSVTTVAVTIGAGGTGATGGVNDGTAGTSSSFGSYLTGAGGAGGTQGSATKAANGTVTGSQPTATEETGIKVNSAYHGKGGLKGVNGSLGTVVVRVIG